MEIIYFSILNALDVITLQVTVSLSTGVFDIFLKAIPCVLINAARLSMFSRFNKGRKIEWPEPPPSVTAQPTTMKEIEEMRESDQARHPTRPACN